MFHEVFGRVLTDFKMILDHIFIDRLIVSHFYIYMCLSMSSPKEVSVY